MSGYVGRNRIRAAANALENCEQWELGAVIVQYLDNGDYETMPGVQADYIARPYVSVFDVMQKSEVTDLWDGSEQGPMAWGIRAIAKSIR